MKTTSIALGLLFLTATARGQALLDQIDQKLTIESKNGFFRSELSGLLDLEGYYVDQRPPGLLFEDESFFNPRLTFFLDTKLGPHFYSLIQARLDRGFDPGAKDFDARLDEYLLRWTPFNDSRLNLQIGKFATVVGNWVQRHDSWHNPLITAPLPYENMTPISYERIPGSPAAFLVRRQFADRKDSWLPVIWGPAYTSGGSVFGTIGKIDYALEFKNASVSSNPDEWEVNSSFWRYPTVSGRLGFRPAPEWNHGISFSVGPYMSPDASGQLPGGKTVSDYDQVTLGYDVGYAWHRWQLWGEVFLTRFEVPNVGNADLIAYYVEAKYKLTARLFAAARWNQELYGSIRDSAGEGWGRDMFRIDLALGYRFTRHFQVKVQYSFGHREGSLPQQGEQLVAAQATVKF